MIVPRQPQTPEDVAGHYDELDLFYREIWGEHVHHGLWTTGRETASEAVEALVACLADRLRPEPGQHLCDVGCGYGATAEWLARRYHLKVTGLTLSARQAARASARRSGAVDLHFLRQDWLENRFEAEIFDHVIAVESSEHMADKQRFFNEAYRTLRSGGKLAVCAWLARAGARLLEERHLLEPICREGRLPGMGTEDEYHDWATHAGFAIETFEDLSRQVQRTWTICAGRVATKLLTDPRYGRYLIRASARNRTFALTLLRIGIAYKTGSMRYGLLIAQKP